MISYPSIEAFYINNEKSKMKDFALGKEIKKYVFPKKKEKLIDNDLIKCVNYFINYLKDNKITFSLDDLDNCERLNTQILNSEENYFLKKKISCIILNRIISY